MKNPKISVIVPVYNVGELLYKCIDSILGQTYKNIELILVDDESTDGSGEVCDSYAKKDGRVKVIHKKNGGVSSARNKGLEVCTGDYVNFIDGDDWISPDTHSRCAGFIESDDVDCVIYEYIVEYPDRSVPHSLPPERYGLLDNRAAMDVCIRNSNDFCYTKVYRRSLIGDTRFDSSISRGEDTLFVCAVMQGAQSVYHISDPFYHYFQSAGSAVRRKFHEGMLSGLVSVERMQHMCREKYPELIAYFDKTLMHMAVNFTYQMYCDKYKGGSRADLIRLFKDKRRSYTGSLTGNEKRKFGLFALSPRLFCLVRRLKLM